MEAGVSETGHPTRCTGQTDDKMGTSTCRLLEGGATEKDDELLLIGDLSAYHGDWESVPSNNPSYFVAAVVSFGSLAVGYGLGFTSPAAHQLQAGNGTDPRTHGEHLSFEADDISWFGVSQARCTMVVIYCFLYVRVHFARCCLDLQCVFPAGVRVSSMHI